MLQPFLSSDDVRIVAVKHELPFGKGFFDLVIGNVLGAAVIPETVVHGSNRDKIGFLGAGNIKFFFPHSVCDLSSCDGISGDSQFRGNLSVFRVDADLRGFCEGRGFEIGKLALFIVIIDAKTEVVVVELEGVDVVLMAGENGIAHALVLVQSVVVVGADFPFQFVELVIFLDDLGKFSVRPEAVHVEFRPHIVGDNSVGRGADGDSQGGGNSAVDGFDMVFHSIRHLNVVTIDGALFVGGIEIRIPVFAVEFEGKYVTLLAGDGGVSAGLGKARVGGFGVVEGTLVPGCGSEQVYFRGFFLCGKCGDDAQTKNRNQGQG